MEEGAVCMPNIGPRGQRSRMVKGVVSMTLAAALLAWMVTTGQPPVARLALGLLLFFGSVCIFQARAKT